MIDRTAKTEHAHIQYFSRDKTLLAENVIDGGAADRLVIPIRDIVKQALNLDAGYVSLAHHHPSGDASPSKADIDVTRNIVVLLKQLGIRLDDHVITSLHSQFSFRDAGLI